MPSAAVLVAALVFSVGAHFQAYMGLGVLRAMLATAARDSAPSSEIEIVLSDPPEEPTPHDDLVPEPDVAHTDPTPEPPRPRERRHPRERPRPRPQPATPPTPPAPQPPPPTVAAPVPQPPAPPPPPAAAPPPPDQRAAIIQHSDNPDQPPPESAQFVADENRTVEEETMAQITSRTGEDDEPHTAAPDDPVPAETAGDSSEHVVADTRDSEGSDARTPTPEEEDREDPEDASSDPSTTPRPQVVSGTDATSADEAHVEHGAPSLGDEGGARALGGQPMTEVMISDGFGSYTVRVPVGAPGDGGGTTGGHRTLGSGRGTSGRGLHAGHAGAEGGSPHEHGTGEREAPNLGVSYAQLEAVYGEEELERERHARLERRRSRARGSASEEIWDRFRAASESYVAGIRPGNQTALNAAASPFARFLHDMHVRIHAQFVEHYLASLSANPDDPLNDMSLHTTLEIAINEDGTIDRVGIVETSGQTLFDLGAFTAVWRAQPYPHPPSIILSGDGHAWLRYRFDRGPRQCGTWNATPFLLDNGEAPPVATSDTAGEIAPALPESDGSGIEMIPAAPIGVPGQ